MSIISLSAGYRKPQKYQARAYPGVVRVYEQETIMSPEFYFWCIVDQYLSTGHATYREALKFA